MNSSPDDLDPSIPELLPEDDAPEPKKKESLLRWWAILPAALFILMAVLFNRPPADNPRANEAYLVGFIVGGCTMGLVLGVLSAWVTYHVTRRSTLGSSLMFSLVVLCVGLMMMGQAMKRTKRAGPHPPGAPQIDPVRAAPVR